MSSLLFIMVMEALNEILTSAIELELFRGLTVGVGECTKETTRLFLIDDTMLFCEPNEYAMLNLICVFLGFQAVLGLSINLTKSEMIRLGDEKDSRV